MNISARRLFSPDNRLFTLAALLFFSSGFSALALQVAWRRILSQTVGIDYYSTVLIVSLFMLGLGLGAHFGGLITRRAKRPLYWFIGAEIAISLFALVSNAVIRSGQAISLFLWPGDVSAASLVIDFAIYFTLLIVPITLMGLSLPILVHELRRHALVGAITGYLYGINILGAVLGAAVTGLFLLAILGISGTLLMVAIINGALALLIFAFLRAQNAAGHLPSQESTGRYVWNWRYVTTSFVIGFIALGYEVLYFRLFTYYFGLTGYAFPLILTAYLFHLAGGTIASGWLISRGLRLSSVLMIAVGGAVLTTPIIFLLPDAWALLQEGGHEQLRLWTSAKWWNLLVCFIVSIICLAPVFFLSMFFPALVHRANESGNHAGTAVAQIYLVQTLGNFAGALLTGALLAVVVGTAETVLIFVIILVALGLLSHLIIGERDDYPAGSSVAILVLAIPAFLTINPSFYSRITFTGDAPSRHIETKDGTVFIYKEGAYTRMRLGGEPTLGYATSDNTCTNPWPMDMAMTLLKRKPRKSLHIGIGSAVNPILLNRYAPDGQNVIVELLGIAIDEMQEHASPNTQEMLAASTIHIMDGERFVNRILATEAGTYDFIQVGILHVSSAGAGNLFTREFQEKLKTLLSEDGVLMFNGYANPIKASLDVFDNVVIGAPDPTSIAQAVMQEGEAIDIQQFTRDYLATREAMIAELSPGCDVGLGSPYFYINKATISDLLIDFVPQTDDRTITEHFLLHRTSLSGSRDPRRWPEDSADLILQLDKEAAYAE